MFDYLIIFENLNISARLNKNWRVLIVRRLEKGKIDKKLISNGMVRKKKGKLF
jgi:hypothetical protein